jgi:hypothetical protein
MLVWQLLHGILKSALARAVEQQALTRNPADALKRLPKVEPKPIFVGATRNSLLAQMISTQIAEAQRRASEWKPVSLIAATEIDNTETKMVAFTVAKRFDWKGYRPVLFQRISKIG